MTTPLSGAEYDVLNVVALKKMTTAPAIAADTGLADAEVEPVLSGLAERGLVATAGAHALPTDAAGPALAAAAGERYADLRTDPSVTDLLDGFETTNTKLLAAMSAWQQVDVGGEQIPNDHTDARYDDRVVTRVGRLVEDLQPLLTALSGHDARFGAYPRRLAAALEGVDAGDQALVSSPVRDSVHTIWFEFHEDLLRALGRDRKE